MKKIDKTESLSKILENRRFTVDYFQREYRWGKKQVEQMLTDFQSAFEENYSPEHDLSQVERYGFYYMGCIICSGDSPYKIIDGQQRLTSLTLLLIYISNLQKSQAPEIRSVNIANLIYADHYGRMAFNLDVDERTACMEAIWNGNEDYVPDSESAQNLVDRYHDIEELFPDDLKGETLPYFIYWLKDHVLFLEIDTPSEDEAHTIFLTMNDRGLSLNSAEMMKAYIIQHAPEADRIAVNHQWQANINRIKGDSAYDTSGAVNTQDVEFISIWLRAKYAQTLRESKRGAKDEDFELLGEKFHTWVRANYARMGLQKQKDFKAFVMEEMTHVTNLYLRIRGYCRKLTPGYEEVFYNADRDLNYQIMLIIAAVRTNDPEETVARKIRMTAKFVDDFASIRIFNYKKINWNTNKYLLFRVMRDIRDGDLKTVGMVFVRTLRGMEVQLDGITGLRLNQFTGRYMLHILARFTAFVNVKMGNSSRFDEYIDRRRKGNTYDIEHILPDDYDAYKDLFEDADDFAQSRQRIGNLILLTKDKNRSYQDMPYTEKVRRYAGDNILAQSLEETAYHNNPHFLPLAEEYGFEPMPEFTKDSIRKRAETYLKMAADIWNPHDIREIAGGWSEEEDRAFAPNRKAQEWTVGYAGRSWPDALKYGFLSASTSGSGRCLYNIQAGDLLFCYMRGCGFVGIGECTAAAVPMKDFAVEADGVQGPVDRAPWISEDAKRRLDPEKEIFIRVKWLETVSDPEDGYREKGLKLVPLTAYRLSDSTTYEKVKKHFGHAGG